MGGRGEGEASRLRKVLKLSVQVSVFVSAAVRMGGWAEYVYDTGMYMFRKAINTRFE